MSIITLITDFGNKDHFVAKIKGDIYSSFDKAKIVDISNNVSPFNIMEAAYILENSYKSFPENSVHIIDVDSEKTIEKKHIVVCLDNHFFISADNSSYEKQHFHEADLRDALIFLYFQGVRVVRKNESGHKVIKYRSYGAQNV